MPINNSNASALSPEYALLGLLMQKSAHGYDLHQRLITELGQMWRVSLSQTYNILHRLEKRGFIRSVDESGSPARARQHFRLTANGRRRFIAWLNAPSGISARAIRVEFLTRLYFANNLDPDLAHRLLDAQAEQTQAGLSRLKKMLKELPGTQLYNRLGLELRIRQLQSIMGWLAECRRKLDQPT